MPARGRPETPARFREPESARHRQPAAARRRETFRRAGLRCEMTVAESAFPLGKHASVRNRRPDRRQVLHEPRSRRLIAGLLRPDLNALRFEQELQRRRQPLHLLWLVGSFGFRFLYRAGFRRSVFFRLRLTFCRHFIVAGGNRPCVLIFKHAKAEIVIDENTSVAGDRQNRIAPMPFQATTSANRLSSFNC